MPAMTYASLIFEVTAYINREDAGTLDRIPDFIYQAEQRIALESKNIGLESYVVGEFIATQSVYPKPARWRRNLSLNYGIGTNNNQRVQLYLRSYEFCRAYWPNSTLTGSPKFYADYGYNNILIAPTPDVNYPYEYCFLQLPEPLTESNQTNWLTNNAPQVLLYATLLEAAPFLKNHDDVGMWQQYYQKGIDALNLQDDMRIVDRASARQSD